MNPQDLLIIFIALQIVHHLVEVALSWLNKNWYSDPVRQREAAAALQIPPADMEKTLAYSLDKYKFSITWGTLNSLIILTFIAAGGLGWLESVSAGLVAPLGGGPVVTGLAFFALAGLASGLLDLPGEIWNTFGIEEKHGFNRQTPGGFISDRLKGLVLAAVLGGLLLSLILWVMEHMGQHWWIMAWLLLFGFSLLAAWLYPTFLAPLFNKFSPIDDGELRDEIFALARKVDFNAGGLSIMDASRRSTHGNAYFTGAFGKKKIVLFDTLVKSMGTDEIVAVLAHELGHFKLHHIRWRLIRSFFMIGAVLYALSLCIQLPLFYEAFHMAGVSNYGALVVFSLWFGPISFLLQPLGSWLSRRNEFDADRFALDHIQDQRALGNALLKLRESNRAMPLSHPAFSTVYHSHPPMLERLKAMGYI